MSVPWIKSAKVSRKLPNEIHIFIEEYEPAAIWENKNEVLILDKDGYHIEKIQKKMHMMIYFLFMVMKRI